MARKKTGRVEVTKESDSGRNERFVDTSTNHEMTRPQFVRRIKQGDFPNYHIRKIDGVETPAANPDNKKRNNLG